MNIVKEYAKSLAAAVVGVLVNLAVNLANGATPWPHSSGEWVSFLLSALGPAVAAVFIPNKISDKQIDKDPTVVRVEPQPDGGYVSPWPTP